jgi:creatinine amidohydrolase
MDQIDEHSGQRLGRLDHLTGLEPGQEAPIGWYANFPDHYAGDARPATAEKGERLLDCLAQRLAEAIKAVKEDRTAPVLYDEFFQRTQH